MEKFPQYDLSHIYEKQYWEGGLTYKQFIFLLEQSIKRENEKMSTIFETCIDIIGSILGVKKQKKMKSIKDIKNIPKGEFVPFGDPEEYKNLSKEERENLTQAMIDSHKPFISNNENVGAKKLRMS